MGQILRVLVVEDSEADCELLLAHLARAGYDVTHELVQTADAMQAALDRAEWDLVLSDYSMPMFSATEALSTLRRAGLDIPFIIVSGTIGEETAVHALKSGAHDFLTKRQLSRLIPAIEREVREAAERRKLRTTETVLTDTREQMRFALEAAGVGTWESDLVSGKTVWSDMLERMHGIPTGGFGRTFEAFIEAIYPDDRQRVRSEIAQSLRDRTDFRLEYRVAWPDGSIHWLAGLGRPFYSEAGEPVRAAGVAIDITGQKRLEEQLRQSQKMEAIGNVAGGIAHDFNNLLSVISGYSQLLADRFQDDAAAVQDFAEIRHAVDSAAALTRQLLAFSRRQILAPRVVNLNEILDNLRKMLNRLIEENVRIDFRLAEALAPVNVDPNQIEQAVLNLAVNARDAMPNGGILTVETAEVIVDDDYVRTHAGVRPGAHVMLSISDTGSGIAPEIQARLFEPFFTTKPPGRGTGLGLATVFGTVKQSGGHIWVYSELGIGTTFKVYFPVASRDQLSAPEHPKAVSGDLTGTETVLVVEDDARLRALDEKILRRYGYTVLLAEDAAEARRICAEYSGQIHLVVTDVVMPGGSGRTLGDWILQHHPETKVLYMSGYTDNAIVHHGVLDPGVHFLQKPFTPEAFVRKIREVLS
jgi:PAS domain S-box-containing protein